jgi:hypothetical protein
MSGWRAFPIRPRAQGLSASPYYDWTRATDFRYYGEQSRWLPVLIALRGTTAQEFAQRVLQMQQRKKREQAWAARLRVPAFYAAPPERLRRPTRHIALLATRRFLREAYQGGEPAKSIERFELGAGVELSSGAAQDAALQKKKLPGGPPEVVSAVIDDGIAFAHERFLSSDGTTRIEYLWDQLTPSLLWGYWGYGRELTKHDPVSGIDRRMRDAQRGPRVDEDQLYRLSQHLDFTEAGHKPLARRLAHGTHVMDLAVNAGNRPKPATRPIIAVQLPTATTADTSGATLGPQIYNGLGYIIEKADAIAAAAKTGQLPVVVNVSYGLIAGPHDGSSLLEVAMDELLDSCNPVDKKGKPLAPPFRVVLPAGNSHLSRCHAGFEVKAGESRELHWRVLPDDWSESYMEIWLPDKAAKLSITLTAPDGSVTGNFSEGVVQVYEVGGVVVARAVYHAAGEAGRRAMLWFGVGRTAWPDGGVPLAPAGLWRIRIENLGKQDVSDIHAWIQRDDTPVGYPRRSRQSYFDDPEHARYDDGGRAIESDDHPLTQRSYVKRACTLNAIATGQHPIVVGALRRSDWAPAAYSSSGPVLRPPGRGQPNPDGPEALSISDDTPSHWGVLAAGARSGSSLPLQGTSVAAPQIARWVAEELAQGRAGDRKSVAQYTGKIVAPPDYTESNPPAGAAAKPGPERGGDGRIEFPSLRKPRAERL